MWASYNGSCFQVGVDHDAPLVHSIFENTGRTFSLIEAESVTEDAFDQCFGGLLGMVVQQLKVAIEGVVHYVRLWSMKAGCKLNDLI